MKIARHHPLCIDLLHLDGKDLRQQTLLDRRAELHHLIGVDLESRIQFSEEFERSGLERRRKMPKKRLELSRSLRSCGRSRFCRARAKAWQLACKEAGTTEQSYYRYRKEYGVLGVDQAKRLKRLEDENNRLKKLVADFPTLKPDEDELTRNIVFLASEYGRYGYRDRQTPDISRHPIAATKERNRSSKIACQRRTAHHMAGAGTRISAPLPLLSGLIAARCLGLSLSVRGGRHSKRSLPVYGQKPHRLAETRGPCIENISQLKRC